MYQLSVLFYFTSIGSALSLAVNPWEIGQSTQHEATVDERAEAEINLNISLTAEPRRRQARGLPILNPGGDGSSSLWGCYPKNTLTAWTSFSPSMSVDACVDACNMLGYGFAGVSSGNTCSCGRQVAGSKISSSSCNQQCNGNSGDNCGGSNAMQLYSVSLDASGDSTFMCPDISASELNSEQEHTTDQAFVSTILRYHNMYRLKHNSMPLTYNNDLAAFALNNARKCVFEHTKPNSYGENIGMGTYTHPGHYLSRFYREVDDYDFNNPGWTSTTGHFTQLVWQNTAQVGCAWTKCQGGNGVYPYFLFCEYQASGNWVSRTGDPNYFAQWVQPPNSLNVCDSPSFVLSAGVSSSSV